MSACPDKSNFRLHSALSTSHFWLPPRSCFLPLFYILSNFTRKGRVQICVPQVLIKYPGEPFRRRPGCPFAPPCSRRGAAASTSNRVVPGCEADAGPPPALALDTLR